MLRWDETDGSVSVFRQPAMNSNGHTVDLQGRLVSCEHRSRCVSRTEFDGTRTVLADRYEGKRFNSPNDVVVKSDGSIWFTDPSYGIDSDYEGDAAPSEIGANNVYRIDPASGARDASSRSDFVQPNGLAFSPDESLLYVADTGLTHERGRAAPRAALHGVGGRQVALGRRRVRHVPGRPLRRISRRRARQPVAVSAGDGVHCHASDGSLIGRIAASRGRWRTCASAVRSCNRLFICATTSLYSVFLEHAGSVTGCDRLPHSNVTPSSTGTAIASVK